MDNKRGRCYFLWRQFSSWATSSESGTGSNIDLVGRNLSDSTLDVFGIDNLVLIDDVGDHFSTEEELEDDGDEDDDGGGDIGDDLIRGLMDIWTISMFFKYFYFKNLYFVLYEFMFDWMWTMLVYWIIVKVCYFDLF